jgi:CobQ-like glutamine amidotransferase family enzyme
VNLTIGYLYPTLMNLYGDRGNVITLSQRARWRGINADVRELHLGDPLDPDSCDILFLGGGQDKEQALICDDLQQVKGKALVSAVEAGAVVLAICGGYQLLGHYFKTGDGAILPGLGIFDAHTVAGSRRCIGDVVVECTFIPEHRPTLVGFENHSGKTYLSAGLQPLGKVLMGMGNNGEDGTEGAISRNAYGCYLHGSLLPKNPWFADHLILTALRRRYDSAVTLAPLDDAFEQHAHESIMRRVRHRGRVNTGAR